MSLPDRLIPKFPVLIYMYMYAYLSGDCGTAHFGDYYRLSCESNSIIHSLTREIFLINSIGMFLFIYAVVSLNRRLTYFGISCMIKSPVCEPSLR